MYANFRPYGNFRESSIKTEMFTGQSITGQSASVLTMEQSDDLGCKIYCMSDLFEMG
jgi:hypothetical protein